MYRTVTHCGYVSHYGAIGDLLKASLFLSASFSGFGGGGVLEWVVS
jgi:hypothetical protein